MTTPGPVTTSRLFWPAGEAAQADYELLRAHVISVGSLPDTLVAARFARRGMAGLIAWPTSESIFDVELVGATRAPWSPHHDARLETLAEGFALLLNAAEHPSYGLLAGEDHQGRRGSW